MKRLEELRELVRRQELQTGSNRPPPVVTLEEFFEGNDDLGSIGCNLIEHPGTGRFYEVLREVQRRPNVQTVIVEIHELMEGEGEWPFAERIYVLTSASPAEVEAWVSELKPSEVEAGWIGVKPERAPTPVEGHQVVGLWWD